MVPIVNPSLDFAAGKPEQARRRIPVSLRIFAANVVLFCVVTSLWVGVQVSRRHFAIRAIEQIHGRCRLKYVRPWLLPSGIPDLRPCTFLPVDEVELGSMFFSSTVSDRGLENLRELTDAYSLYLRSENVSDSGMPHVQTMTELRRLDILCPNLTDGGVQQLKTLNKLERLSLASPRITDAGLAHLNGLANLEVLVLDSTLVTDRGIQSLTGLTKLRLLRLRNSRVTDEGVAELHRALPALTKVDVDDDNDD